MKQKLIPLGLIAVAQIAEKVNAGPDKIHSAQCKDCCDIKN